MSPALVVRQPADVLPTSTVMATVDVREAKVVAVSVKNTDALQTLDVTLERRADLGDDWAPAASFEELTAIPAGATRSVDVDVGSQMELRVVGVASGAGLAALVTVRPDGGRR